MHKQDTGEDRLRDEPADSFQSGGSINQANQASQEMKESRIIMKNLAIGFLVSCALLLPMQAQSTTRPVVVNWVASPTPGISGYWVYKAIVSTGPFTTPINGTLVPAGTTTYTDTTGLVGTTEFYAVSAVGPACTSSTPVTSTCGSSSAAVSGATPIPVLPAGPVTVSTVVN